MILSSCFRHNPSVRKHRANRAFSRDGYTREGRKRELLGEDDLCDMKASAEHGDDSVAYIPVKNRAWAHMNKFFK